MRAVFWIGVVILALGIASFFVPVPHNQTHELSAGKFSIGVRTHSSSRVPLYVSAILLAGGVSMVIAGGRAGK